MFCCVFHRWDIKGVLQKGPYPLSLRMADRALLAGYPQCKVYVLILKYELILLFSYHCQCSNVPSLLFQLTARGDLPANAAAVFDVLVQFLCVEHMDYALELGLQGQSLDLYHMKARTHLTNNFSITVHIWWQSHCAIIQFVVSHEITTNDGLSWYHGMCQIL